MKIQSTNMKKTAATRNVLALGFALLLLPSFGIAEAVPVDETHGVRLIELEGGRNFRDLGGYETVDGRHVKPGLLFRSGVLSALTANDYEIISELDIDIGRAHV